MYEDFNYITDENFLINYWREEKVICQCCKGTGKIPLQAEQQIVCEVCQGTGMLKRKEQQQRSMAVSLS